MIGRFLILIGCVLYFQCSQSPVAGGSTTTDNAKVVVMALYSDGSPAANVRVSVRTSDYVSDIPLARHATLPRKIDTSTDSSGMMEIELPAPEHYCIEINDDTAAAVKIDIDLQAADRVVKPGPLLLQSYAAVTGFVDRDSVSQTYPAYVQVFGLERRVQVDSDGSFVLTDLPAGTYRFRIVSSNTAIPPVILDSIETSPGATDTIPVIAGWRFQARLIVNTGSTGVPLTGDVFHFPLLVRLHASNFDFSQCCDSGQDIRFLCPNRRPLHYAIEEWDSAGSQAAIRVLIDTIRANDSAQFIIMQWGNPSAPGRSNATTVFGADLHRLAAFPLNEPLTDSGLTVQDVTGNGYDGIIRSTFIRPSWGIAGRAFSFTDETGPINNDVYLPQPHKSTDTAFSWSAWFYPCTTQNQSRIIGEGGSQCRLSWGPNEWENASVKGHLPNTDTGYILVLSKQLALNTWHHAVLTVSYTSLQLSLYINGVLADRAVIPPDAPRASHTGYVHFGGGWVAGHSFYGSIDEVGLYDDSRTESWIRLNYENQRPDSDFPLLQRE
jgi:hypothetical protein